MFNVLVVDDSNFFQHRLKDIINEHPELKVVGVATNGQEAIDLEESIRPDIITMDYEMPLLDGVSAVKAILAKRKLPIIMFSSLTYEGAKITVDALNAGAVDFISKNFSEISQNSSRLKAQLHDTLLTFARQAQANNVASLQPQIVPNEPDPVSQPVAKPTSNVQSNQSGVGLPHHAGLLVIGASTGGPVAVNQVLEALPTNFALPVVIIQHMPPNFTRALAERLNRVCQLRVKEAENGDRLEPGLALIAQGGCQLMFDSQTPGNIKVFEGDDRVSYKPSVDIAFASAANVFGRKVLGIVLTGMGADGCEGAKILKQKGGELWSQNRESCVVYGMPKAVADEGLADHIMTPEDIGLALTRRG